MKTLTVTLIWLLLANFALADCNEPPALGPNDIPFVCDVNWVSQVHVVDYKIIPVDSNITYRLWACDDTNEPWALAGAALPSFVNVEPNDWLNWGKYMDDPNTVYRMTLRPTVKDVGIHHITITTHGKWSGSKEYGLAFYVEPDIGKPPFLQPLVLED